MAKRTKDEVAARDEAGRKQCGRCEEWLPETFFAKQGGSADGLQQWCGRCKADGKHHLSVGRRQQMLADQNGKCACGFVFDAYGSQGVGYEIDHDHGHCPGERSCGECVRALVCRSCNQRDRNNPDRTGHSGSKYRGVSWNKQKQKWVVGFKRGGKNFSPTVMDRPCLYDNEDEAGRVAAQLDAYLDANPQLWRPVTDLVGAQ
jgi:hypothetical protein